jgi:hypothetical protein
VPDGLSSQAQELLDGLRRANQDSMTNEPAADGNATGVSEDREDADNKFVKTLTTVSSKGRRKKRSRPTEKIGR